MTVPLDPAASTAIIRSADLATELGQQRTTLQATLARAQAFAVVDPPSFADAGAYLAHARERRQALDERRKAITRPLLDAKKSADDLFAPAIKALEAIEATFRQKMNAYRTAEEAQREADMRAAALAMAPGAPPADLAPTLAPTIVQGVRSSTVWFLKITDASAVPREYLTPDIAKIEAVGRHVNIPGVEWYSEQRVTVR